jgi:hypothetical protein
MPETQTAELQFQAIVYLCLVSRPMKMIVSQKSARFILKNRTFCEKLNGMESRERVRRN